MSDIEVVHKPGRKKNRPLSEFMFRERLHDFTEKRLDPLEHEDMELFAKASEEAGRQLKNFESAINYCQKLQTIKITPETLARLKNSRSFAQKLALVFSFGSWPLPLRWGVQSVLVAGMVALLVNVIPWSKIPVLTNELGGPDTIEIAEFKRPKRGEIESLAPDGGTIPRRENLAAKKAVGNSDVSVKEDALVNAGENSPAKAATDKKTKAPSKSEAKSENEKLALGANPKIEKIPVPMAKTVPKDSVQEDFAIQIIPLVLAPPPGTKGLAADYWVNHSNDLIAGTTSVSNDSGAESLGQKESSNARTQIPPKTTSEQKATAEKSKPITVASNEPVHNSRAKNSGTTTQDQDSESAKVQSENTNVAAVVTKKKTRLEGFVYRAYLFPEQLGTIPQEIADGIRALGGKKAGRVELGWRRKGGSYFHFTVDESKYDQIVQLLNKYGVAKISKDAHRRVMPSGQKRFILWVEPIAKGN